MYSYNDCPICKGIIGDVQCHRCHERVLAPPTIITTNPPRQQPLTAEEVRLIVREEIVEALRKYTRGWLDDL